MAKAAGQDIDELESGDDDLGHIIVTGDNSSLNMGEQQQPQPQPVQRPPSNGIQKFILGALLATGLLGAGGLGTYVVSQLVKPDPPAKVQPAEPESPPKYKFTIR